jgi:MFS family permease
LLTGTFGLGTALGFVGAGAIVQALGWRALFWIGAGSVAVAIGLVTTTVPRSTVRSQARLDLPGGVLLTGGLALILVALTEGTSLGWGSPWIIGGFVAGAALLAGWIAYDLRVEQPLLDLHVLARRTVLLANLSTIGLGFAMFGSFFLVPYLVQGKQFGADTLQTGLFLLPAAVGQVTAGPLAPRLARALGPQWVYALGLALPGLAGAWLALAHATPVEVVVGTLLLGTGSGLAIGVGSDVIAEAVDEHETGIATSLNSVLRRVGGGVGGQVAAALLAASAASSGVFSIAFWTIAGVAAASALVGAGIRAGEA